MKEQQAISTNGEVIPGGIIVKDTPLPDDSVSTRQLEIQRNSLPSSEKEFVQRAIEKKTPEKKHFITDFIDELLDGFTPDLP